MKSMDELDDMTLRDITDNEGILTMLVLSITFAILAVMYTIIGLYYKVKYCRLILILWHRGN